MSGSVEKRDLRYLRKEVEDNDLRVYEILSADEEVLYIGAGPLRSMLEEHLPEGVFPLPEARFYRSFTTANGSDIESTRKSLLEDFEIICGRRPKYNRT
jgi:hypothetical protein